MKDQAEKLRMKMQSHSSTKGKTLAVVSGKGGVGKTNISINIALSLARRNYRVLLFDFDIGMGNVQILLGISSAESLSDFLKQDVSLDQVICKGPEGISYISAGNGLNEVIELSDQMLDKLIAALRDLQEKYDYIIFDMAAGATASALKILVAAEDIIVVATPEPTAMTDAYSMMKYISMKDSDSRFLLICNRADHEKQGNEALSRLQQAAKRFLNKDAVPLGVLPEDRHVRKAVIHQTAFSSQYPRSNITLKLEKLISCYLEESSIYERTSEKTFINKLRRFFSS